MILINKKECEALQNLGFKFGSDLNKTVGSGRKKTYYATESYKLLQELKRLRSIE